MKDWLPLWMGPWLLKWAVIVAVPLGLSAAVGMPHILTRYEYRDVHGSPVYLRCNYVGPFGTVRAVPGEDVYEDCPGIAFFPWDYKGYYQR